MKKVKKEINEVLLNAANEMSILISKINDMKRSKISCTNTEPPEYDDYQTTQELIGAIFEIERIVTNLTIATNALLEIENIPFNIPGYSNAQEAAHEIQAIAMKALNKFI